jgi:hypothetical protein
VEDIEEQIFERFSEDALGATGGSGRIDIQ